MDKRRNVILVTDGDSIARRAVEVAAYNVGARCISMSAGNPTPLSGEQLVDLIKKAVHDPVVVMLDDRGFHGEGRGEKALRYITRHDDINVLGVLAVASNTNDAGSARVTGCVDRDCRFVNKPVDKKGQVIPGKEGHLKGDTVEVLDELNIPVVIGIGDIGKMNGSDEYLNSAPVTTMALKEIINRSGYNGGIDCCST